jgi:hypothetical protein
MPVLDIIFFIIGVAVYASIFGVIIWAGLSAGKPVTAASDQKAGGSAK